MGIVNETEHSARAPKLSEVLFKRPSRSFASLAHLPSNVEAIDTGLLFSAGLVTHACLVGPSGWGKTHLLEAVAFRFGHESGVPVDAIPALEYLEGPLRPDSATPLLLDDCQEVFARPRLRMTLRYVLERRVRSGRPTMMAFTAPKPNRQLKTLLPACHDWSLATIGQPEPAERVLLLNQMAATEGLALSPSLVRIVAHQMHGNGRTISGVLKRLRLSGPEWLDSHATLRACGLLDPFFSDNSAWDLKHRIQRVAEVNRAQFSRVSPGDLAIYTMLKEACLSEAEVARVAGAEPADVYLRASRFQKELDSDPVRATYVRQFIDLVVQSLVGE